MTETDTKFCYLFDIDGTIANIEHRVHHLHGEKKDWKAFFAGLLDDTPYSHMHRLVNDLYLSGCHIVFMSGRSEEARDNTVAWMSKHGFPTGSDAPLYMRTEKDYREDFIVKGELLDKLLADGYRPIMAFDDRKQVVDMWRKRGVPCAQMAEGNF